MTSSSVSPAAAIRIAASGGHIASTLTHTRAAAEQELLVIAKKHATWFLRGGTTTIEAKSYYGLTEDSELNAFAFCVP